MRKETIMSGKKTTNGVTDSDSRLLARWRMELAHHLQEKHGVCAHEAIVRASHVCRLLQLMGKDCVYFKYRKSDGSVRHAAGTLAARFIPESEISDHNKKMKEEIWPRDYFSYYDVVSNGWRSFTAMGLMEYDETKHYKL